VSSKDGVDTTVAVNDWAGLTEVHSKMAAQKKRKTDSRALILLQPEPMHGRLGPKEVSEDMGRTPCHLCSEPCFYLGSCDTITPLTDLVLGHPGIYSNLLELQRTIMYFTTLRRHLTKS
jgi:hypothetical protein